MCKVWLGLQNRKVAGTRAFSSGTTLNAIARGEERYARAGSVYCEG